MCLCRWLGFRLEFLGAVVVFTAALFAVIGRGILSASIVGLAISYALQVCHLLHYMMANSVTWEVFYQGVQKQPSGLL